MSSFAFSRMKAALRHVFFLTLSVGCALAQAEEPSRPAPSEERALDVYSAWLGERVGQTIDETAAWLDSRFGNLDPRHRERTFGHIRVVPLWVEHRGWEYDTRFRARIDLPNLHRRLHAAFGAGDSENFVTDRPVLSELEELSLTKEGFHDRSFLAGLGYSLRETERSNLSLGAGLRVRFPLEPYVRARYVRVMPLGSRSFLRFHETVYARNHRGVGSVTAVDYERLLSHRILGRATAYAHFSTWDERPQEFGAEMSAARALDRRRVLALTAFILAQPRSEVDLQDYGARIIYRQQLSRRRLYGELHVGYSWPRHTLEERRRPSLNLGVGLELHFGERRNPAQADFGSTY